MRKFFILLSSFAVSIMLRAQDTPSVYKVHFITSSDLRYDRIQQLKGVFAFGNPTNLTELHFKDSLQFEEHIYFGIDSLISSPGKYNYDPSGWLILKGLEGTRRRFALLSFYKFMFLVQEDDMKKFEMDFETAAGRYQYSKLKSFKPDQMLLKACKRLSDKYFVMLTSDP
jgi:hypothetical protein